MAFVLQTILWGSLQQLWWEAEHLLWDCCSQFRIASMLSFITTAGAQTCWLWGTDSCGPTKASPACLVCSTVANAGAPRGTSLSHAVIKVRGRY